VELRQLRYFLAVSEELHFGRAALRLNVSQPPLSVAIRQLERELGVSLFDRTSRRVRLTDEGLVLKARARDILDAVDALSDLATSATAFDRGHLTLGFANSAGLTILPRTITSFRAAHPRVELTLVELTSAQQVDALHDGSIDLGLLRGTDGAEDIATEEVLEEELVAAIPEGHHLASESPVGAGELAGEPLVFVSRRLMPGYFDAVMSLLRAGGTTPRIVQRAVQQETITGLVAAQVGCSILPASTMLVPRPGVVYRPIRGRPPAPPLALAVSGDGPGRLAQLFGEHVRRAAVDFVAEHRSGTGSDSAAVQYSTGAQARPFGDGSGLHRNQTQNRHARGAAGPAAG
jgi:DNA-binding transcriptional LysR family regulator